MPYFIDWHQAQHMSDEEQRAMRSSIQAAKPDQFGVIDRGIVFDRAQNRMYCILEAPDEKAVRRHHEAAGVPVDTINPAEVMLRNLEDHWS